MRKLGKCIPVLLFLVTALLLWGGVRAAKADVLEVGADWEPKTMSASGEVTITVAIGNTSEETTISEIRISRDGTQLGTGGPLKPGESTEIAVGVEVSLEELGKPVTLTAEWEEDGATVSREISFTVNKKNPTPSVTFERKVSTESILSGETVTVTYEVTNTGECDISDIKITDGFGTVDTKDLLEAGGKTWVATKTLKSTKSFSTEPVLTYTAGDVTYNVKAATEKITIRIQQPSLSVRLDADTTHVKFGESINLVGTLVNNGSVRLVNLEVFCGEMGKIYSIDSLEPGATCSFSQSATPSVSTTLKLTVTAEDDRGNAYSTEGDPVSVEVVKDADTPMIELYASCDTLKATEPMNIRFTLTLKNEGHESLSGVRVLDPYGKLVAEFLHLPTGTQEFTYTMWVEETEPLVFTAELTDEQTGTITFAQAPSVTVQIGSDVPDEPLPAAEEEPTPVPEETAVPQQVRESFGLGGVFAILGVIFALAAVAAVLTVMFVSHKKEPVAVPLRPGKVVKRRNAPRLSRGESPSAKAARAGATGGAAPFRGEEIPDFTGGAIRASRQKAMEEQAQKEQPEPIHDTIRFAAVREEDDWGDVESDDLGATLSGQAPLGDEAIPMAEDDDIVWDDVPPEDDE